MSNLNSLKLEIKRNADPQKAKFLAGFFKTKKGDYGHGDFFWGITVPAQRKIALQFKDLSLIDIDQLLKSKYHEERLIALLLLIQNFKNGNPQNKKEIFDFYLKRTKYINNWDLVDLSAPKIIGEHLLKNKREILYKLANSKNLWEKRIAIVSTYQFIINKDSKDTLKITEILLNDPHDLIQKAVGWMLREVGKRVSKDELIKFLSSRYKQMPRTMLRYSIEHFDPVIRKAYLEGKV